MQNIFLRRGVGLLLCVCGLAVMLFAVAADDPTRGQAVAARAERRRTLVIDAGHGGEDGGAVAADGTPEAEINLAISQRLCMLAELCGVQTVMTRETDEIDYPASAETTAQRKKADQMQRVEQINAVPNGVLISVHQNCYPTASPRGSQVLYAATADSEAFGTLLHEQLVQTLDPENRRVAAPISRDIYLMRNVQCPAVLVECGFLSNEQELALLRDPGYEVKLALVMIASYLQYWTTGWVT